jgi:hypothetical protein
LEQWVVRSNPARVWRGNFVYLKIESRKTFPLQGILDTSFCGLEVCATNDRFSRVKQSSYQTSYVVGLVRVDQTAGSQGGRVGVRGRVVRRQ